MYDLLSCNKEDLPLYDTANSVTLKGLTEIELCDEEHFYSFAISVIQKRYNAIFMQTIDKMGWYNHVIHCHHIDTQHQQNAITVRRVDMLCCNSRSTSLACTQADTQKFAIYGRIAGCVSTS